MATTVPQPKPSQTQPPAYDTLGSARAALARRESPRRQIIRLLVLIVAIAVLVDGWIVTDINLGKLANAAQAGPILKALLQPDVTAREVKPVDLTVPFIVGAGSNGPATDNSGHLTITPGSASPGQMVVFE